MRSEFLVALLCLVAAGVTSAQAPAAQQKPTFRASTDLVVVDVAVLRDNGEPAKDLGTGDFVATVDGQPRHIASVQYIDESVARRVDASTLSVVSSNAVAGGVGRMVLIVVDEAAIRFGGLRAAAESVDRLLARFGPSDRIALAALPGPRMLVDFGIDRTRIAAALKRIPGGAGASQNVIAARVSVAEAFAIDRGDTRTSQSVEERECRGVRDAASLEVCRTEVAMEQRRIVNAARNQELEFTGGLRSLLQALAKHDIPKIVILFSEGLTSPEAPAQLAPLAYDAAAARAVIYALRLDKVMFAVTDRNPDSFFEDQDLQRASLETLTGASRGRMLEIVGSAETPFERLARELSGYYLIGIEAEGADRDGKSHRIHVTTGRSGLTVRARPTFTFVKPATPSSADPSKLLTDTLQSPVIATAIPLRVTTAVLADEDASKARVMILAEIGRGEEGAGAARVGYAIYDDRGNVLTGSTDRTDVQKSPAGPLTFTGVSAVPEGAYTLKLAAVRDGKAGSVEHPLTVKLTGTAPFRLGDLLVRDPVRPNQAFAPSLDPVVTGEQIMAFMQMRVERDVPRDAAFTIDIVKDENGPALMSAPGSITGSRTSVRTVQGILDGRLLPPGEYGARLAASVGGKPAGRVFARFALDRARRGVTGAGAPNRTVDVAPFQLVDVLAPAALAPFLDALTPGAAPDVAAALAKAREGAFDEAARQVKGGAPNDPRPPFLRGLALLAKGQIQDASDRFREAMRADPEFLAGAFFVGTCYAAGGKEQTAINAWQTSLISLDGYPLVYRVLVDAHLRNGHPERALELLDEALAKWPDDLTLRARLVRTALEAGRYERLWEAADRLAGQERPDPAMLFLAMDGVLQAALEGNSTQAAALLARLERYRDLYVAAGGPQQPLVAAWVAFVQQKAKQ